MKKFICTIVVLLIVQLVPTPRDCTLNIKNCICQWVQGEGFSGGFVYSLAISGNNIFAGTDVSGVYLSTNNGSTWTQTALNNRMVYSLVVSGNNIFAGINGYGVYLSTNNGQNWSQTALNNKSVYSLAVSGNNIFAGTYNYGVYLSINNGTTWTQTALNNKSVYSLAVSGNNIFAGTGNGVYFSTSNGTTWTQTALNNKSVHSLIINGNNIFAGTYGSGVYLSTNNGTTWIQTALNNKTVLSLAVSGNNPEDSGQVIFAGTDVSGVYLSTNNGQNWLQKNQGFTNIPTVYSLLIANNYIFAGTDGYSVWRRELAEIIGIQNISTEIPSAYSLEQNYPNPFNSMTNVKFQLKSGMLNGGNAKIIVFDILGKEIKELVNEELSPGTYQVNFDGSNLTSGIYFYRMTAGDFIETRKMILIK